MKNNIRPISENALSPKWLPQGLSEAEADILELLAGGKRNADIAEIRGVSVATIKVQMGKAMDKLGVPNRVAAAVRWSELKRAA